MFASSQNTLSGSLHIHRQCRRNPIRVDMNISYRRILHDCPRNNRQHKLHRQSRYCKISRDSLASQVKAKSLPRSSMTSRQRITSNGNTISLPRALSRPLPRPIQPEALLDAFPELDDVSDAFVRRQLPLMAPNMISGIKNTQIIMDNISGLPSELPVVFNDSPTTSVAPTHILALSTPTCTKTNLILIHQLPFAVNCSSFPTLPKSSTATPVGNRSTTATLPVIRLSPPSVEAFHLFQMYLYVKDPEALRTAFLPTGWTDSIDSIIQRAILIKGFWSNAFYFGTLDDHMFEIIDECWADVLRTLNRATRYFSFVRQT